MATNGGSLLGVEDFNHRFMNYSIKLIKKYNKENSALGKLMREALPRGRFCGAEQ